MLCCRRQLSDVAIQYSSLSLTALNCHALKAEHVQKAQIPLHAVFSGLRYLKTHGAGEGGVLMEAEPGRL